MSEDNNGTTPSAVQLQTPQPPRQGQAQLNMQLNPQGVTLTFPVNLAMDNETAMQFVEAFLDAHPELMQKIARKAVVQMKQELAFIRSIEASKNG